MLATVEFSEAVETAIEFTRHTDEADYMASGEWGMANGEWGMKSFVGRDSYPASAKPAGQDTRPTKLRTEKKRLKSLLQEEGLV